jgi:hypothetical protein
MSNLSEIQIINLNYINNDLNGLSSELTNLLSGWPKTSELYKNLDNILFNINYIKDTIIPKILNSKGIERIEALELFITILTRIDELVVLVEPNINEKFAPDTYKIIQKLKSISENIKGIIHAMIEEPPTTSSVEVPTQVNMNADPKIVSPSSETPPTEAQSGEAPPTEAQSGEAQSAVAQSAVAQSAVAQSGEAITTR